jgi:hypothetical protein
MSNGLFVESQYLEGESGKILRSAAYNGLLGAGWTFAKNRRSYAEWLDWLKAERAFNRHVFRKPKWSCSPL